MLLVVVVVTLFGAHSKAHVMDMSVHEKALSEQDSTPQDKNDEATEKLQEVVQNENVEFDSEAKSDNDDMEALEQDGPLEEKNENDNHHDRNDGEKEEVVKEERKEEEEDDVSLSNDDECGLYLAPSSIRGAGVGVFAGRDYEYGEWIGPRGIGIQVTDASENLWKEVLAEYGWNSVAVGGDLEAETVFTFLPGIGMLANFHPLLANVLPGGLTQSSSPSSATTTTTNTRGSFTNYHNFTFLASKSIAAGEEIFGSVGEEWFTFFAESDKDNPSSSSSSSPPIPLGKDYQTMDKMVLQMQDYYSSNNGAKMTDAQFVDWLRRIRTEIFTETDVSPALQLLLPRTMKQFQRMAERGSARAILQERNLDWLRQNGQCLDHIREGPSTIPGAGRGAFATRRLAKDTLVSPAPLVQVMNRSHFDLDWNTDPDGNAIHSQQLLLNYCFSHAATSSLLLCPTTAVVLMNHDASRANVRLQWDEDFPVGGSNDQEAYFLGNVEQLKVHQFRLTDLQTKLSFHVIATRDIEQGEEIFLDYGKEWEDAWKQHVLEQQRPEAMQEDSDEEEESRRDHLPAHVLNSDNDNSSNNSTEPLLLSEDPRMRHYMYLCRLEPFAREEVVENCPEEDFWANPAILPDGWSNHTRLLYEHHQFLWWWPCDVVEAVLNSADKHQVTYRTAVYQKSIPEGQEGEERKVIRRFRNVPRHAIKYVDRPYHSEQHDPNAFRHYIPIPDEIFPLHWRDDYATAKTLRLGAKNTGQNLNSTQVQRIVQEYETNLANAKCGVYIAPSNIPNAGMGTYVGVTAPAGGLTLGTRLPAIPVVDMTRGDWDANDYTWSATSFLAEFEGRTGSTQVLAVNEGCMANFHPGLVNYGLSEVSYRPILDRRKDPGAGAFSDYTDFAFASKHEVEAGEEAFISYGESWFSSRDYIGIIPLSANYMEANAIVASMTSLSSSSSSEEESHLKQTTELLGIVSDAIVQDEKTAKVLSDIQSPSDLDLILSRNGTAEATTTKRSMEWLEEYGYCTDHTYAKQSTLPQAGLGAFVRRHMARDKTIISVPLLHTWGRHMFEIKGKNRPENLNTKQLLYNYQWTHPESSVLFFPTNTAIVINHKSSKSRGGPNAYLRWSTTDKKSVYYLQRHLDDLKQEHYATVVMDVVAKRDLAAGEEVFLDYGDAWDKAWNEHVRNFVPPCSVWKIPACTQSSKYVAAMNDDKFNSKHFAWTEDHFTICERSQVNKGHDPNYQMTKTKNETETPVPTKAPKKSKLRDIQYHHEGFTLVKPKSDWAPCVILRTEDGAFDVLAFYTREKKKEEKKDSDDNDDNDEEERLLKRRRTLPPDSLRYIHKPYKSDMHWKGAFRHEIHIPDHVFPELWKDLRNVTTT